MADEAKGLKMAQKEMHHIWLLYIIVFGQHNAMQCNAMERRKTGNIIFQGSCIVVDLVNYEYVAACN